MTIFYFWVRNVLGWVRSVQVRNVRVRSVQVRNVRTPMHTHTNTCFTLKRGSSRSNVVSIATTETLFFQNSQIWDRFRLNLLGLILFLCRTHILCQYISDFLFFPCSFTSFCVFACFTQHAGIIAHLAGITGPCLCVSIVWLYLMCGYTSLFTPFI